jgi:hypothetical protein
MNATATQADWAVETVAIVAKSFETINGNAFAYLSDEIKNAMLFKMCFSPKVLSQYDSSELLQLHEIAGSWYPRPAR